MPTQSLIVSPNYLPTSPDGDLNQPDTIWDIEPGPGNETTPLPTRVDPFGVGFDIYVPRRRLDEGTPPASFEIAGNFSAVGKPVPYLFGRSRTVVGHLKGGINGVFVSSLYLVGRGEIEDIEKLIIDGTEIDLAAQSPRTPFNASIAGAGTAQIIYWLGDGVQNVATDWAAANIPGYPDALPNMVMIGVRQRTRDTSKIARVEAVWKGSNQVKDYTQTTPTTGYTDNWGNILIHWIEVHRGYAIDQPSAKVLADDCDEPIGGGNLRRRTGGMALTVRQDAALTQEVFRAHAAAFVIHTGARVYFVSDRPATAVHTINKSIIAGKPRIEGAKLSSKVDDVVVHWFDIETGTMQQARAVGVTGGSVSEVKFYGITDSGQANREAVERFNHLRNDGDTLTVPVRNEGLTIAPGEVANFTNPDVLIDRKPYRLTRVTMSEPGLWNLSLREYQDASYSDSTTVDNLIGDTSLPSALLPPEADSVTLTPIIDRSADRSSQIGIKVDWTDDGTNYPWYEEWEVEVALASDSTVKSTQTFDGDLRTGSIYGLLGQQEYSVTVRPVSTANVRGNGVQVTVTTYHGSILANFAFESGSRNVDSIQGVTLTESNTAGLSTVAGKVGTNAAEFDLDTSPCSMSGGSDELSLVVTPWTIIGWVRLTALPLSTRQVQIVSTLEQATIERFALTLDESREFKVWNLDDPAGSAFLTEYSTSRIATLNTWHFVSLRFNGAFYTFGLDGGVSLEIDARPLPSTQARLYFGSGAGGDFIASGTVQMDAFRLYDSFLSGESIESIRSAEA